jgi:hypothetical protein
VNESIGPIFFRRALAASGEIVGDEAAAEVVEETAGVTV